MLGNWIQEVSVVAPEDYDGFCDEPSLLRYEDVSSRERRSRARDAMTSSFAGIEAERLYDPKAPDCHAKQDEENARWISRQYEVLPPGCAYIGDEIYEEFLNWHRCEASRLVRQYSLEIRNVALALSERRSLSAEEVREIIDATTL